MTTTTIYFNCIEKTRIYKGEKEKKEKKERKKEGIWDAKSEKG